MNLPKNLKSRNRAVLIVLVALIVLTYAVTMIKMKIGG
jgi:hypothetical protein